MVELGQGLLICHDPIPNVPGEFIIITPADPGVYGKNKLFPAPLDAKSGVYRLIDSHIPKRILEQSPNRNNSPT